MRSGTEAGHKFSTIPRAEIQRSAFNRSHNIKTTFDAGKLVPVYMDEALPGDTMSLRMSVFARMATPLHPVMDNIYLDTFFFSVPMRLLWDNWPKFNGEQTDPGDSTDFLVPEMVSDGTLGHAMASLHDYLGIPPEVVALHHSSMWHRAYHLIWNEWFRDQNLQDSVIVDRGDGPDDPTDYEDLLNRGKRHDYFTSCLPFPQKGPSVLLPLGDQAPLVATISPDGANAQPTFKFSGAGSETDVKLRGDGGDDNVEWTEGILMAEAEWDDPELAVAGYADLSAATAATINQIRQAFQIQRLYERDARGGTRYTEIIHSHFGVTSPDQRLQRPEFLGGGSSMVNIQPVPQTSESDTTPQGVLTGFGTVQSTGQGFVKSFVEHSIIIGMVSVRADLNYAQGLNRQYSRRTRWDFFWPALAHLGEQSVLNQEIYATGGVGGEDALVFGYQERFAEYRYKPSHITGLFRPGYVGNLASWHLAQEFGPVPTLDADFIEENPPMDRVIAIPAEPHFLFDGFIQLNHARPMPTYGVPGQMDHF